MEETQGERNWTWVLSNTQVNAITRGTKRLLQVVLRDQDTLSAQASKINLVSTDIKRSHRRRSGRRSGRAGVSTGSALLILKGVFGLNGALRMWWTKLRVCLLRFDFVNNVMCRGLFALHDPSGFLCGLICSHGDDMLGTADSLFDVKMEELDKFVGSRQKFDHCGRQYEEHANGEFTVTMKLHVQRERFPKNDGNCWMTCSLRVINGSFRGVAKELPCPFQFVVQRKQGHSRVRNLMRANEVIDEIKQCEEFHFDLTVLDLNNCGPIGVFDASLGGIDKLEYSTIVDSDVVKVHPEAGVDKSRDKGLKVNSMFLHAIPEHQQASHDLR